MIIICIILILLLISFISHKVNLNKETELFVPIGNMVTVNNHSMHIYTEGEGEIPLVFMAGGGTCSPTLDFKSLYNLMSDEYHIVVVEKAGYGFSEITNEPRDIDTILEETRKALELAGETGPYVLFPHSMSGIEALYWAQKYPNEVLAIVGLDPAVPATYDNFEMNNSLISLAKFGANVGIARWIPDICNSSAAIETGTLSDEEKELYRVIFYRRTLTKDMTNEVEYIKESAKKVGEFGVPNIPMLFFVSNGDGTGWSKTQWQNYIIDYINSTENGEYIELECSHYVHDIKYEIIAEKSKEYLRNLLSE